MLRPIGGADPRGEERDREPCAALFRRSYSSPGESLAARLAAAEAASGEEGGPNARGGESSPRAPSVSIPLRPHMTRSREAPRLVPMDESPRDSPRRPPPRLTRVESTPSVQRPPYGRTVQDPTSMRSLVSAIAPLVPGATGYPRRAQQMPHTSSASVRPLEHMSPPPTTKAVELPREQYLKLTRDHELLTSKVKELTASLAEAEGRARRAEQEAAELRRQLRAVDRGETRPSSPPRPVRTHIVSPPPLATWNTASLAPGSRGGSASRRRQEVHRLARVFSEHTFREEGGATPPGAGAGLSSPERELAGLSPPPVRLRSPRPNDRHPTPSDAGRRLLLTALRRSPILSSMREDELSALVEHMSAHVAHFPSGQALMTAGSRPDRCLIIKAGWASVTQPAAAGGDGATPPATPLSLARLGPGDPVGDFALIYDTPAQVTVSADGGSVEAWQLHSVDFYRLVQGRHIKLRKVAFGALRELQLLAPLPDGVLSRLLDMCEASGFESGERLTGRSAGGDLSAYDAHIIVRGEVVVPADAAIGEEDDGEDADDDEEPIALPKGGFFSGKIPPGVCVRGSTTIVTVPRGAAPLAEYPTISEQLFGRLAPRAPMVGAGPSTPPPPPFRCGFAAADARDAPGAAGGQKARAAGGASPSEPPRPAFADLHALKLINSGSFAVVRLVRDRGSGNVYALKVLKKQLVVQMRQQHHVVQELHAMRTLDHPFIVSLKGAFQDAEHLYLLQELVLGGELFTVLDKFGRLPLELARFYAASLTLVLAYMHANNFVYRDLKPENVLIDTQGYVKLCDFGFTKRVADRTWTMCGTPEYMPPEVITGQGANAAADWWMLGILMYEMLVGEAPFTGETDLDIFASIKRGQVHFPDFVPKDAADLISRLLRLDVKERLGYLQGGARDVMRHSVFEGMDWDCLQQRALHPPYQPTVQSVDDTSNFAGQEETTPIDDSRPYDAKRYERLFGDFEAVAV